MRFSQNVMISTSQTLRNWLTRYEIVLSYLQHIQLPVTQIFPFVADKGHENLILDLPRTIDIKWVID